MLSLLNVIKRVLVRLSLPSLLGLLWHEIYISDGVTAATGASVFNGIVLVDRIPPLPSLCGENVNSN